MPTFKIVTYRKNGILFKENNPINLDSYPNKNSDSLKYMISEIDKNKDIYPNEVIIYVIPNTNPQLFEVRLNQDRHYRCE